MICELELFNFEARNFDGFLTGNICLYLSVVLVFEVETELNGNLGHD
jgi:hypothetical protein